jgi:hypothetical protein
MYTSTTLTRKPPLARPGLSLIRTRIAAAMVGQAVDVLVEAGKTVHGVVSGVQLEHGTPKLLVAGTPYDLDQILTATPLILN